MHRKDSRLSDWWNPALEKLIKSAQYVHICEDLTNDKHGNHKLIYVYEVYHVYDVVDLSSSLLKL